MITTCWTRRFRISISKPEIWIPKFVTFRLLLRFGMNHVGRTAISDLLLHLNRAWRWLHGGLHVFALPLLPFSRSHEDVDAAIDPDFWTT